MNTAAGVFLGLFALLVATAAAGQMESRVQVDAEVQASTEGTPTAQVSTQIEANGEVLVTGTAQSGNEFTLVHTSTSSSDSNQSIRMARESFDRVQVVLDDLESLDVSAAFAEEAKTKLEAEKNAFAQAQTVEQRRQIVASLNGYFASFRERIKAENPGVDVMIEMQVSEDGRSVQVEAATAAVSADSEPRESSALIRTEQQTQAEARGDATVSPTAQAQTLDEEENSFVQIVVRMAESFGRAFSGFVNATIRIFG